MDIQCGHLITRERFATRWDPANAKAQCERCNVLHEESRERFLVKWIRQYSLQRYEDLVAKSWEVTRYSVAEIEDLARKYNDMMREKDAKIAAR